MDIQQIKKKINEIEETDSIYLLEAINYVSGFFSTGGKLLFVVKDSYDYQSEGIDTDYLKLQTHVRICAVKNDQTFKDDYYNLITYNCDIEDENISSFVQLCSTYATNTETLQFKEFFYSLIALFQLPTEQKFKNAVGLYGELKFMQYAFARTGKDISNSWHRTGSYSKYDFSNGQSSIEIKTTLTGETKVEVKHDQIFGENPCILLAIICERFENGETIEEVIRQMNMVSDAFKGINYQINLAKELRRVSSVDVKETRFKMKDILFFSTEKNNPFVSIPEAVSDLHYRIDLSELEALPLSDSDQIISSFG